jgi:hypothetical protein
MLGMDDVLLTHLNRQAHIEPQVNQPISFPRTAGDQADVADDAAASGETSCDWIFFRRFSAGLRVVHGTLPRANLEPRFARITLIKSLRRSQAQHADSSDSETKCDRHKNNDGEWGGFGI